MCGILSQNITSNVTMIAICITSLVVKFLSSLHKYLYHLLNCYVSSFRAVDTVCHAPSDRDKCLHWLYIPCSPSCNLPCSPSSNPSCITPRSPS